MPLTTTTLSSSDLAAAIKSEQSTTPQYVIFYASLIDGRSWCGDCRDAEPFVNAKFGAEGKGEVKVVYTGKREEWKGVPNQWKEAPFSITALPTLLKIKGNEWTRLVEEDVYDQAKLDAFVEV